ncbi:MAG: class I SAM-dependent methyltransferase [Anaerolineales bacterium]|nr:class I SAM-dependent methyltransferase [Anaerolineales bacterium]
MGKVSLCPACGSSTLQPFFHLENVPVHQNLLMPSREAAKSCDRGQILLAFCEECGFITNLAFEAERLKYSAQYDNSQVYSATFMAYMERLALELINRHALYNKKIIEIGCGKGEFLKMLCQFGHNRGIGFDPSYVPNDSTSDQVIFIQDFYSERYGNYPGDLICCRHVIEHIQQPGRFVGSLRQTLENQPDTVIFFEMPNVVWILRNLTFWDIFTSTALILVRDR